MTGATIAQRYAALRAEVDRVAAQAGRDPSSVRILAVTKGHPASAVHEAVAAGIADVGENYLQEARAKLAGVAARKHFIGHVQTNKAKAIVAAFDVVQSVDRVDAARVLARAAESLGKRLPVLVQLNISPVERYGVPLDAARELAEQVRAQPALRLDGVMAIGPVERSDVERAFERAREAFGLIGGETLSLGMSGDWREAVRAGSTMIRLGTALFGPRPAHR